jgi:hypothetical protein
MRGRGPLMERSEQTEVVQVVVVDANVDVVHPASTLGG